MDQKGLMDFFSSLNIKRKDNGKEIDFNELGEMFKTAAETAGAPPEKINEAFDLLCKMNVKEEKEPERHEKIYDIREITDRINSELSPVPGTELVPVRKKTGIFDNKLGGIPYMPKSFEYPRVKSGTYAGTPLKLLAQLNFEKLPKLENYPEKGILQFYAAASDDHLIGMGCDDLTKQNGFRVIYHENITDDLSKLKSAEELSELSVTDKKEAEFFPFWGEFLLEVKETNNSYADINDFRFYNKLIKYCSERSGRKLENLYGIERAGFGEIDDIFDDISDNEKFCIGGYPAFVQDDPRFAEKYSRHELLLLQIPSEIGKHTATRDGICWGDAGIANFFISKENLLKRDFSGVLYTWDCG